MQLSPQSIRKLSTEGENALICPFKEHYRHEESGLSGGLSCAGYDVHVSGITNVLREDGSEAFKLPIREIMGERVPLGWYIPPHTGALGVTIEEFNIPTDVVMSYYNKSTLARRFLNAAATLAEPGWRGYLTLEIFNDTDHPIFVYNGQPIGQVVFNRLDETSCNAYNGKYQNQTAKPTQAK